MNDERPLHMNSYILSKCIRIMFDPTIIYVCRHGIKHKVFKILRHTT